MPPLRNHQFLQRNTPLLTSGALFHRPRCTGYGVVSAGFGFVPDSRLGDDGNSVLLLVVDPTSSSECSRVWNGAHAVYRRCEEARFAPFKLLADLFVQLNVNKHFVHVLKRCSYA